MRMRKIMQRLVIVLVLALTLISPLETVSSAASETVRAAEAGGENHTDPVISDVKDSDCSSNLHTLQSPDLPPELISPEFEIPTNNPSNNSPDYSVSFQLRLDDTGNPTPSMHPDQNMPDTKTHTLPFPQ